MEPNFEAVWTRVTGSRSGSNELVRLRRWIHREAESAEAFAALFRLARLQAARETLAALSREDRKHLRLLQSFYYLRTGERCPLDAAAGGSRELLSGLRERYGAALESAESYESAASSVGADLRKVCRLLASEERSHAERLQALTERLL